jgi:hypothetical protein
MKYRVIITTAALSEDQALLVGEFMDRLPAGSTVQVENLTQRKTIRMALILGLVIAFWIAVGTGLIAVWRHLPS